MYDIKKVRQQLKTELGLDYSEEELTRKFGTESFAPATPPDNQFRTTATDDQFKAFASQHPDRDPAILQEGYNEVKDRLAAGAPSWRGKPIRIDELESLGRERSEARIAKESPLWRRAIADPAIALAGKGVVGAGETLVGLADLVSGGQAGKMLDKTGYDPKATKAFFEGLQSPAQRAANANVRDAKGVWNTLKAAVTNPTAITDTVLESIPSMVGGFGIRGAVMKAAPKISGVLAAALGEGVVSAGGSAEAIRQETDTRDLSLKQTWLAVGSGAATMLLGYMGGKLANKLGIGDVDQLFMGQDIEEGAKKNIMRRVVEGALSEGVFEELPQSVQEQMAQNLATEKPIMEGVDNAAVMGALSGAVMGGGINVMQPQVAPSVPAKDQNVPPIIQQPTTNADLARQTVEAGLQELRQPATVTPEQRADDIIGGATTDPDVYTGEDLESAAMGLMNAGPVSRKIPINENFADEGALTEADWNKAFDKETQYIGLKQSGRVKTIIPIDEPIDDYAIQEAGQNKEFDENFAQSADNKRNIYEENNRRVKETEASQKEYDARVAKIQSSSQYKTSQQRQAAIDALDKPIPVRTIPIEKRVPLPPESKEYEKFDKEFEARGAARAAEYEKNRVEFAEKNSYASRKAESIRLLGYEDADVSKMSRREIVNRVSLNIPKGVQVPDVDGVLTPIENLGKARRNVRYLNRKDGGNREAFQFQIGKWGWIDRSTPEGKNVAKILKNIEYQKLHPEARQAQEKKIQEDMARRKESEAQAMARKAETEAQKKQLVMMVGELEKRGVPAMRQYSETDKGYFTRISNDYNRIVANPSTPAPVIEKPVVLNGKRYQTEPVAQTETAATEAPEPDYNQPFDEFKTTIRAREQFFKDPNPQTDEDIQADYDAFHGVFHENNTPDATAVPERGTDSAAGVVASEADGKAKEPVKQVHDHSSTQVNLPEKEAEEIRQFSLKIPESEIYSEPDDDSYGRKTQPHITVRYGMDTVDPKEIAPAFEGVGPIKAKMGKVSIFETDKYDVVKVDIESPDLHSVNKKVGDTVDLPGETFKYYQPHATIAYVKKGEGKKYIGDKSFEGKEIIVDEISLSAKDGKIHNFKLQAQAPGQATPPTPQKEAAVRETDPARVQEIKNSIAEGSKAREYASPKSIETPAQGNLNAAIKGKKAAFDQVKRLRERIKNEPLGGNRQGLRVELLKAEDNHRQWLETERQAKADIEKRANELGKTTIQTKETDKGVELFQSKAITPSDDATYLKAVEAGDLETAQKMVDAAAKAAGYEQPVYHGTNGEFTVFDTNKKSNVREKHAWKAKYPEGTVFLSNIPFAAKHYGRKMLSLFIPKNVKSFKTESGASARGVAAAMDTKYAPNVLKYPMIEVTNGESSIYATLNGNLIKSADPVTYDDNGNIIPLSQRFNPANEDIRYQRRQDQAPLSGVTLKQVQALPFFKGKTVTVKDGIVTVQLNPKQTLRIEGVVGAGGTVQAHLGILDKATGAAGAGKFLDNTITLSQIADIGTMLHEVAHAAEEMGFFTPMEIAAINEMIRRETGKAVPGGVAGKEARAEWVDKNLTNREKYRAGVVGRILQKIADLVDGVVGLFKQTGRGALRALESGKVFDRGQGKGPVFEFAQSPMMSLKEAAKNVMENPKFKKWFGKSAVTDADGKPLVVYHGTGADFTEFDSLKQGGRTDSGWFSSGFYLTPDPQVANQYANFGNPQSYPLYVSIKNPYDWRAKEGKSLRGLGGKEAATRKTKELIQKGYDGVFVYTDIIKSEKPLSNEEWAKIQPNLKSFMTKAMVEKGIKTGIAYHDMVNYYGKEVADLFPKKRTLTEIIAFSPTQIKSIFNNGEFSESDPNILHQESVARWFSQMEKTLEAKLPGKINANMLIAQLDAWAKKGEYKADELEWSGIKDWLKGQKDGKVTKAEVLEWLAANNISVREVVLGGESYKEGQKLDSDQIEAIREANNWGTVEQDQSGDVQWHPYVDASDSEPGWRYATTEQINKGLSGDSPTQFGQYQTFNGENYREVFLTVPSRPTPTGLQVKFPYTIKKMKNGQLIGLAYAATIEEANAMAAKLKDNPFYDEAPIEKTDSKEVVPQWHDGHGLYSDIQNPAVRIRMSEKEIDGKRYIAVEEIQPPQKGEQEKQPEFMRKPDYWGKLAFRWLARHAAENGFDGILWTPGQVQADRYDLSKQIDSVEWELWEGEKRAYYTKKGEDRRSMIGPLNDKGDITVGPYKGSNIADVVGKEIAEKILASESGNLTGLDLKIGGTGLANLYDRTLPAIANGLFNKAAWGGAKVGEIAVEHEPNSAEEAEPVSDGEVFTGWKKVTVTAPMFPITPEMRAKALREGMPLMQEKSLYTQKEFEDETPGKDRTGKINAIRIAKTQNTKSLADVLNVSPDKMITVYRGIPENVSDGILPGDFVTHKKEVAMSYNRDMIRRGRATETKTISKKVKAGEVKIHPDHARQGVEDEFIYNPGRNGGEPLYQTKKLDAAQATSEPSTSFFDQAKEQILKIAEKAGLNQDLKERLTYNFINSNDPLKVIQGYFNINDENLDAHAIESLRGKKESGRIKEFRREVVQPLVDRMAKADISFDQLDEYRHAKHAPEANERLELINAKRTLEGLISLKPDGDKTANKLKAEMRAIAQAATDAKKLTKKYQDILSSDIDDFDTLEVQQEYLDLLNRQTAGNEAEQKYLDDWDYRKVRLAGITNEEAAEITAKYNGNAEIEAIRKAFAQIDDNRLTVLEQSGELSPESAEAMREAYQFYAPLYREGKDGKLSTGRKLGPLGTPVKVRAGSTRAVSNVSAHTIANFESAISRSLKAETGRTLYELVKKTATPDKSVWWVEEDPRKPAYDKDGNIVEYPDMVEPADGFFVKVGGKRHLIKVNVENPTMVRFLDSLKSAPEQNSLIRGLSAINRVLAAVNTSLSPEFMFTNLVKDLQTASIHLEDTELKGLQKTVLKQLPAAIKGIWNAEHKNSTEGMSKWYRDFEQSGGKVGWSGGYEEIKDISKRLKSELDMSQGGRKYRRYAKAAVAAIESANTAIENGVRLSVYKSMVEMGYSKQKAATVASGLTVDFTKKGKQGGTLNALYLFANAGIQGNVRMINAMVHSKRVQKIVGGIIAGGFVMNMLGMMMGGDDDDDGMSNYDKLRIADPGIFERNIVIMTGKNSHIKIPMPWGYNAFYNLGHEIGNATYKVMSGESYDATDGAGRVLSGFANSFNPLSSATLLQAIAPTVADPLAYIGENKMWHGGPMMPDKNTFDKTPKPDSERYFKSVSAPSKAIASALNTITGGDKVESGLIDVSPETLDMWYDTVTGSAGRFVADALALPMADDVKKVPFVRRFVGGKSDYIDSEIYNDKLTDILTLKEKIKEGMLVKDRKRGLIPLADTIEKKLRRLRKAKKRIEATGGSTDSIEDSILLLQKRFIRAYEKY